MAWRTFNKIISLNNRLELLLYVDKTLIDIIWALHKYCNTEVLAYVRKVKDIDIIREEDKTTIIYYVLTPLPFKDIYIPKQRVTQTDVQVLEQAKPEDQHGYAVIHTHPPGITRFSNVDREYINVNHTVSILVEGGEIKDASINLIQDKISFQVTPEIKIIESSLTAKYKVSKLNILNNLLEIILPDISKIITSFYLNSIKSSLHRLIDGCHHT